MKRFVACLAIIPLVAWVSAAAAEDAAKAPKTASLEVRSSSFPSGGPIPRKYTKEGEDLSPALEWSGAPSAAKAFAVIMDDPDVPLPNPFVHWVAYGIAGDTHALPEAAKTGFVAGKNHFGALGYGGPMPPPGAGRITITSKSTRSTPRSTRRRARARESCSARWKATCSLPAKSSARTSAECASRTSSPHAGKSSFLRASPADAR
jgi:phosphatidylethanolamine-binding protein (PEBP) family uncharacterized protein